MNMPSSGGSGGSGGGGGGAGYDISAAISAATRQDQTDLSPFSVTGGSGTYNTIQSLAQGQGATADSTMPDGTAKLIIVAIGAVLAVALVLVFLWFKKK